MRPECGSFWLVNVLDPAARCAVVATAYMNAARSEARFVVQLLGLGGAAGLGDWHFSEASLDNHIRCRVRA
jgi:hypothetical protein